MSQWLKKQVGKIPDAFAQHLISAAVAGLLGLIGLIAAHLASKWLPDGALTRDHKLTIDSFTGWFWSVLTQNIFQGLLLTSAIVMASAIVIAIFLLMRKCVSVVINAYNRRHLVQLVGLSGYWPDARAPVGDAAWEKLRAHIQGPENPILNILGSTGIDTFGRQGSPLWECISKFNGEIRIILMSPDSEFLPERAHDVNMSERAYREEIKAALEQIDNWHRAGRRVSYRTYDAPPNWKLILTNRLAWVQYYRHQKHVQETPVYQFYATFSETGLFHVFNDEFARIWRLCGANSGKELKERTAGRKVFRGSSTPNKKGPASRS